MQSNMPTCEGPWGNLGGAGAIAFIIISTTTETCSGRFWRWKPPLNGQDFQFLETCNRVTNLFINTEGNSQHSSFSSVWCLIHTKTCRYWRISLTQIRDMNCYCYIWASLLDVSSPRLYGFHDFALNLNQKSSKPHAIVSNRPSKSKSLAFTIPSRKFPNSRIAPTVANRSPKNHFMNPC